MKDLFEIEPYSLNKENKSIHFDKVFSDLTRYHYKKSSKYKKILDVFNTEVFKSRRYVDTPFLPVRIFKEHNILSISNDQIFKTLTSSGTTGQSVSKIYLDKKTAHNQSKALVKIISSFLGTKRTPMIIIDSPSVLKNREMFSARGAGILGFSIFGTKKIYALNEKMELDIERVKDFINEHKNKKIFIFGFTFMIYKHFIKPILDKKLNIKFANALLIHGGGWKKLENEAISALKFKEMLKDYCGIRRAYDYYGMVEQTGSIYMECEFSFLHASVFSDIIIRRSIDFKEAKIGEEGIIQTLSVLPKSYPGHSLLTEDLGILIGIDDCQCGRKGKYFKITGRIKKAEIRGCSDTYEP